MNRASQGWFPLISRPQAGQQIAASTKRSDWTERTTRSVNSQSEASTLSMLGFVGRMRFIIFSSKRSHSELFIV